MKLPHGSLMYRNARLAGYDAPTAIEFSEHLGPPRLTAFGRLAYTVRFLPVGPDEPDVGSPAQMAVFTEGCG